jgi:hypothetical protein
MRTNGLMSELAAWRKASRDTCLQVAAITDYIQPLLENGGELTNVVATAHRQHVVNGSQDKLLSFSGLEAQQALKATLVRLEHEVKELKAKERVQSFHALQQDLKQRDKVNAALRALLRAKAAMPESDIDKAQDEKVWRLYSTRESHQPRVTCHQLQPRHFRRFYHVTTCMEHPGSNLVNLAPTSSFHGVELSIQAHMHAHAHTTRMHAIQGAPTKGEPSAALCRGLSPHHSQDFQHCPL